MKKYQEILEETDVAIIMETGINKQVKPWKCNDKIEVRKNNTMEEVTRHERQHNGAGAMVLIKEGINSQKTHRFHCWNCIFVQRVLL